MPPPKRPWFRLYVEIIWDRKLRRLPASTRWLYVAILALARASSQPGYLLLTEGDAMTAEDIADAAALPLRDTKSGIERLQKLGLIERDKNADTWFLPKWNERQYESDTSTDRTAKHRSNNGDGTSPEYREQKEQNTETEVSTPPVGADAILREALTGGAKYPDRYKAHLGREVKSLLTEGFPRDQVTEAAKRCVVKGLSPGTLPSLLVQVSGNGARAPEPEIPEL